MSEQLINNRFDILESRINILESLLHRVLSMFGKPDPRERLSRSQVKQIAKVSFGTIHNAMKNGDLKYSKLGRKTVFLRSDVDKWIGGR